jgi:hypothetical protein
MNMSCRDGGVFGGACAAAQRSPEGVGHNLPWGPPGSPCSESRSHIGRCWTAKGSRSLRGAASDPAAAGRASDPAAAGRASDEVLGLAGRRIAETFPEISAAGYQGQRSGTASRPPNRAKPKITRTSRWNLGLFRLPWPQRLFDLNGEANRVRKWQNRAIIAADVRRLGHAINTDEVFGTHSWAHGLSRHLFSILGAIADLLG